MVYEVCNGYLINHFKINFFVGSLPGFKNLSKQAIECHSSIKIYKSHTQVIMKLSGVDDVEIEILPFFIKLSCYFANIF
jgi:hypothetical protein